MSDENLIEKCAEDESALEQLFLRYRKDVFAFSLSICRDRTIAEDCVGETFIRLVKASKAFKGGDEAAFILGTAKNVTKELLKTRERQRRLDENAETYSLDGQQSFEVTQALMTLPKKYREIIMLRVYSGMSFHTASGVLKITESAAKARYQKGLRLLKKELEKC